MYSSNKDLKMFKRLALLSIVCLFCVGKSNGQTSKNQQVISLFKGKWNRTNVNGNKTMIEEWATTQKNNELSGRFYVVKGKDTTTLEVLSLVLNKKGKWVYLANPKGQNPTEFTADSGLVDNRLSFTNLKHDDPNQITYQFSSDSKALTAYVFTFRKDQPNKVLTFKFTKE